MLEMSKINQIPTIEIIKTINYVVSNNLFIKNSIKRTLMPELKIEDQISTINYLLFNPSDEFILVQANNLIEWTPIKLYQSAYYMGMYDNKFWLVYYSTFKGFDIKYNINVVDYIFTLASYIKSLNNIKYLKNELCLHSYEINYSINYIKTLKYDTAILIKKTHINNILINHYVYKFKNYIFYFPVGNTIWFKPKLIYSDFLNCSN